VVVIARHGDRVPIARTVGKVIADSPQQQALWQSKLPPPEELAAWRERYPPQDPELVPLDQTEFPYSQLTVRGAQELRALGSHLRSRYVAQLGFLPHSLLGKEEEEEEQQRRRRQQPIVYARATNIRRTQQSAQNLLLGLYPEGSLPIEVGVCVVRVHGRGLNGWGRSHTVVDPTRTLMDSSIDRLTPSPMYRSAQRMRRICIPTPIARAGDKRRSSQNCGRTCVPSVSMRVSCNGRKR
jgi:hypothetical protein